MSRIDVTQDAVLQSILTGLQTALSLSDRQCFEVARPSDAPALPPGGDFFCTVAFGDGRFPPDEQVPGNITEETDITVSVYNRIREDSTGHDTYLLRDAARGLLPIKKRVLAALVGDDLVDDSGNTFLRQWCHVVSSHIDILQVGKESLNYGLLQLVFGISWDWDLTQ